MFFVLHVVGTWQWATVEELKTKWNKAKGWPSPRALYDVRRDRVSLSLSFLLFVSSLWSSFFWNLRLPFSYAFSLSLSLDIGFHFRSRTFIQRTTNLKWVPPRALNGADCRVQKLIIHGPGTEFAFLIRLSRINTSMNNPDCQLRSDNVRIEYSDVFVFDVNYHGLFWDIPFCRIVDLVKIRSRSFSNIISCTLSFIIIFFNFLQVICNIYIGNEFIVSITNLN